MATTPSKNLINDLVYTRIINNSTEYLIQNVGASTVYVAASDTDLGATTATDLGGYKLGTLMAIDNAKLKDYAYVYAKSLNSSGIVSC